MVPTTKRDRKEIKKKQEIYIYIYIYIIVFEEEIKKKTYEMARRNGKSRGKSRSEFEAALTSFRPSKGGVIVHHGCSIRRYLG